MNVRDQLIVAIQATKDQCAAFSGMDNIDPEHRALLEQYAKAGAIKIIPPKRKWARDLYLPLMCSTELKGLSLKTWLTLLVRYMPRYGLESKLSTTTAAEYFHKFELYAYKSDMKETVPTVLSNADLGRLMLADEAGQLKELFEEEDENNA